MTQQHAWRFGSRDCQFFEVLILCGTGFRVLVMLLWPLFFVFSVLGCVYFMDWFLCMCSVIVSTVFGFHCSWVCSFYGLIFVHSWCCQFVCIILRCVHFMDWFLCVGVLLLLNDLFLFSLSSLFFDVLIVRTDFVHVFCPLFLLSSLLIVWTDFCVWVVLCPPFFSPSLSSLFFNVLIVRTDLCVCVVLYPQFCFTCLRCS